MESRKIIDVQKISYSYPLAGDVDEMTDTEDSSGAVMSVKALDRAELQVEKGQFICILGSNGSGKSTLARHLNALLVPDEGTVWIGDLSTNQEEHIWDIRSQVGMVFQNPDNQMIASVVDEEVAFGLENIGVPSEQIRERVHEALRETGMEGFEKEHPYYLSGGQKQRIAIAGILAMKPSCIVLDESTAMLDPGGRQEIMDTVLKLNREHGITIISITHFMEEAVYADRVFVMEKGRILLSGTPEEVFSRTSEITQAGLRLPMACQLAERLRQMGMIIPKDIITAQQLTAYLNSTRSIY